MFIISFVGLSAAPYPEKVPVSLENVESYDAVASARIVYDAIQRTRYQKYEGGLYIYSHKSGHISIGDHDRVTIAIYTKDEKWAETRLGTQSISDTEQAGFRKLIRAAMKKYPKYKPYDETLEYGYRKIIQPDGYWLEVRVYNKTSDTYKNMIVTPDGNSMIRPYD